MILYNNKILGPGENLVKRWEQWFTVYLFLKKEGKALSCRGQAVRCFEPTLFKQIPLQIEKCSPFHEVRKNGLHLLVLVCLCKIGEELFGDDSMDTLHHIDSLCDFKVDRGTGAH